jgi:hypothetical protein
VSPPDPLKLSFRRAEKWPRTAPRVRPIRSPTILSTCHRRRRRRGLRATVGCSQAGLRTACITKVFPTRSHTVAAQGGVAASLANMGPDTGSGTCTTPSRGRTGWAIRIPSNISAATRRRRSTSSSTGACPSRAPRTASIYQRPFGGMTTDYGKGPPAQRTCAAADRTGHAMLHTLYGQALRYNTEFFIEYFAIDLIMDEDGRCRGVVASSSTTARSTASAPQTRHSGDGRLRPRLFLRHLGPYLHRRRQRHGAARRPAAAGHGIRAVPPDRHLRRGLPHHRGRARRGRLSHQFRTASASWSAMRRA